MAWQLHSTPTNTVKGKGLWKVLVGLKEQLNNSTWSVTQPSYAWRLGEEVNVWPNMDGPLGCVRILTLPRSMIAGRIVRDAYKALRVRAFTEDYFPRPPPTSQICDDITYDRDIHVWTDGSAMDNGMDGCTAGSAWTSDLLFDDKVKLMGAVVSNNVAEVAAVVLCLLVWRDAHLVIHTDSTYVLGLLKGGLLAMERDGWGDAPRHLCQGPPPPCSNTYCIYSGIEPDS